MMTNSKPSSSVSWLHSVMRARCPSCAASSMFQSLLKLTDQCPVCGFSYQGNDTADGPIFIAMMVVGAMTAGLAVWMELSYKWSLWLHVFVWPLVGLGLTILCLRLSKSLFVTIQYRCDIGGFKEKEK